MRKAWILCALALFGGILYLPSLVSAQSAPPPENPQDGAIGIQGIIETPAPTQGATITIPTTGQVFTNLPVTVGGLCPSGLLVKIYKNNVFAGAVDCVNGSFSLQIDLFSGANELVARVFDDLDQPGPDSNIVTVTYNNQRPGAVSRVLLTSIYAKRGANPGSTLVWPIQLSGGRGPYAITIDWGDGKEQDLISREFPGNFNIEHVYDNVGTYIIIIRATDADGVSAYLQLVGVANGDPTQSNQGDDVVQPPQIQRTRILWEPAALAMPMLVSSFWLGKKYQMKLLRKRIAAGDNPFARER